MNDWEWFMKQFAALSEIDLTAYKRPQMERRINSFMRTNNAPDYKSFIDMIRRDKELYRRFIEHLTINVSEFFRNPNHWEILEKDIIPELLQDSKTLRVWSAGCSTGEEPYSLAMLFKERFGGRMETIMATDLDRDVMERASIGLYNHKAFLTVPDSYRHKYFTREGEFYRISDEIKKMVQFKHLNLLKDEFPRNCDLILCRNVVIYFTEDTKQVLYRRFSGALKPGGVIFIGSTEQIFQPKEIGLHSVATFFYRKAR